MTALDRRHLRTLGLMRALDMTWHQVMDLPVSAAGWLEAFETGRRQGAK